MTDTPHEPSGEGLLLEWTKRPPAPGELYSGGKSAIECPNCLAPLDCMLAIPAEHPVLPTIGLSTDREWQFAMCWRCVLATDWLTYREGRVLAAKRGIVYQAYPDLPYPDYPTSFAKVAVTIGTPTRVDLWKNPVPMLLPPGCAEHDPHLEAIRCRGCWEWMRAVAIVWDPGVPPSAFTGNSWCAMVFWACHACGAVSTTHFID
ncbi:MAG: hypothetical protein U1F60_09045 [Planctomycetota bacterium]